MTKNLQLGLFWGSQNISCAQSLGHKITKIFQIALSTKTPSNAISTQTSDGLLLISLIQKGFEKQNIRPGSINLSLPVKDIIFRSFIVPAMHPNELKSVIEFEVRKYIPFSLDELSHAFHAIRFTEEGIKKQRIIFAAIKKSTLLNYIHRLEQIGLEINVIEPSPLSLIRYLLLQNHIGKNETVAIIEKTQNRGKIFIVDQLTPLFVREFQLSAIQGEANESSYNARLINEIRISLDYFIRQDRTLNIQNVLLITPDDPGSLPEMINKELQYSVKLIDINFTDPSENSPEIFNAIGVSFYDQTILPGQFNLIQSKAEDNLSAAFKESEKFNLKPLIFIGAICAAFIITVALWSKQAVERTETKIRVIEKRMGSLSELSINKLKQSNKELENKLEQLKNTRLKSDISDVLAVIPTLLPEENTWIKTMTIGYKNTENSKEDASANKLSTSIFIVINGYVYTEDPNEQFPIVDQFIRNLKNHSFFEKNFRNINLDTMKLDKIGEYQVTNFKIKCE